MKTVLENKMFSSGFVVPPLPKEVQDKLPSYCPKPNKNNLATQYYFWVRELSREIEHLQKEKKELQEKNDKLEKAKRDLEQKLEETKVERDRFKGMLFKPKREKQAASSSVPKPRTKQSYIRPLPRHIDEKKEAALKLCPHCDSKLSKKIDSYERIVEDIPSFEQQKVKVIQHTINRYYCKHCKKIVSAKPRDVLPRSRLGPNTLLYVLYCKYRLRLTLGLIVENLQTSFNLKVSEGEIVNLLDKGIVIFQDKWKEIIEKIKSSKVVNPDETGWRIDGENCWLWAFAGDKAVKYTASRFRGKGVPKEVLGKDFNGVVVSDFYSAYNQFKHKQKCWVHLLRKIRELAQQSPSRQRREIKKRMDSIHQRIISFRDIKKTTKEQRNKKAELIKEELQKLSKTKTEDRNLQIFLNRISKYSGELVVCVKNFAVPPDNNKAERAIRPAVIMRKISGGSRSAKGAHTFEVNLSVIETLKREKQNIFSTMKNLVRGYLASIG